MTRLILFIHQNSEKKGRTFLKIIRERINNTKIEICPSIEKFEQKLKQYKPYLDTEIVVLFADNEDRLNRLYEKKNIFQDKKIVIVLPKSKNHEIAPFVHKFFPRYFTFIDDKYDDLCEVLNKMVIQ